MKSSSRFFYYFYFVLIIFFLKTSNVVCQFSIVSTFPANGSQGIDTASTFSITFNSAIDTSARFDFPDDFFINMYFYPMDLLNDPDSVTLSSDMKTVYFYNLHLSADTSYFFMFVNAVSQLGDSLNRTSSIVFSTGTTLNSANISGIVNYPFGDPTGTVVALFNGNPFGDNESFALIGTVAPSSSGSYFINYVEEGKYWPAAIKNFSINKDGDFRINENSLLGFVDNDFDNTPDSFNVSTTTVLTNINIVLEDVYSQTAKNSYSSVQTVAANWAADSYLVRIGAFDIDPAGKSIFWQYIFYSPSLTEFNYWFVSGNLIASSGPVDEDEPQTIPIPINWMDSDSVLAICENAGGEDFRNSHPDAEILVRLGFTMFIYKDKISFFDGLITSSNILKDKKAIDPTPAWMVQYGSDNDLTGINFILDPVTGEILDSPQTAASAEEIALPFASDWATDAALFMMQTRFSLLDTTGKALLWDCMYYSSSLDSFWTVRTYGKIPAAEGPPDVIPLFNTTIAENWVDSDVALVAAEDSGGREYRNMNPDYNLVADLERWFFSPHPEMTVWTFTYISSTASDLQLIVNASNGSIVGVEEDYFLDIPQEFKLYQNYPNPFNPTTKINYSVPQLSLVQIKVFDVLGNEIITLVSEKKAPGTYEVEFNASGLSAGVYFYQLQFGKNLYTKKLVFLK